MSPGIIAFIAVCAIVAFAFLVCVGPTFLKEIRAPAASRIPLPDVGGSPAGFDFLPCPSSLVEPPPLAGPPRPHSPVAQVYAMGRGLNRDYFAADDVAITITDREVWLEVDKDNLVRVKRIKRLHVDDRREVHVSRV